MGAPGSGMKAADQPAAESLLTAFKSLSAAERRRHASVLNYWLSVRGDKEFPPLHDLDPLELSDAGPNSVLLELISGGHDAEVRHLGEALRDEAWPERIIDAPNPSVLACIAKKLPIVAISRDFLAFEDEYEGPNGKVGCSVTLLPLSAGGAWVDYVYALVSVEGTPAKAAKAESAKKAKSAPEPEPEPQVVDDIDEEAEVAQPQETVVEAAEEPVAEEVETPVAKLDEPVAEDAEPVAEDAEPVDARFDEEQQGPPEAGEPVVAAVAKAAPGFSKLLDSIAGLTGFYGSQPVKVEPVVDDEPEAQEPVAEEPVAEEPVADEPVAEEPVAEDPVVEEPVVEEPAAEDPVAEEPVVEEPAAQKRIVEEVAEDPSAEAPAERPAAKQPKQPVPVASEGTLQNKLTEVRAKADEARMARLKAQATLYEGLGAAYDFALDAEEAPEEYLRLVEAQGLKIQLRSPMKPVVKLAFAGMCDDATIKQLEAVLAWAFEEELPRGTLAEKIEAAGGIGPILTGQSKAA